MTNAYRHPDAPNAAPVGLQGLLASACYRYNALSAQVQNVERSSPWKTASFSAG